jgi:hypothetical protein
MAATAAAAGVRGRIGDDRGAEPGRHRGAADPDGAGHSGRGGCATAATSVRVRAPGELGVPATAGVHLTNLLAFAVAGLGFRPARLVMALPWLTVAGTEYLLFRWWFAVDLGTPARAVPPHPVRVRAYMPSRRCSSCPAQQAKSCLQDSAASEHLGARSPARMPSGGPEFAYELRKSGLAPERIKRVAVPCLGDPPDGLHKRARPAASC